MKGKESEDQERSGEEKTLSNILKHLQECSRIPEASAMRTSD